MTTTGTVQERRDRWKLLQPLAARDFRLLWLGESVSVLGTQFHMVAMPWLVLQLTGSGLALGTVLMTSAIPRALLMLAGGAFSDRFAPRAMMLWANGARGTLTVALTVLTARGSIALWHVYAIAAAFGAADAFFYPAYVSMAPRLLPPERLASGNALLQGTTQLAGLVGPAIGGVMVARAGVPFAFGLDAASFVFSFMMIVMIAGAKRDAGGRAVPHVLHAIGEGLRYAWADSVIRGFLLLTAAVNLTFIGPFWVGSAVLAHDVFGGASALGVMLASFGGGAFVGTFIAGSLSLRRRGWLIIGLGVLVALALPAFAFAPNVWAASTVLAFIGATGGVANVVAVTFLQMRAEEHMRGRVMSVVMFNAVGLTPFSFAIAGALVEVSLRGLFCGAGALVLLLTLYVALRTSLSELD